MIRWCDTTGYKDIVFVKDILTEAKVRSVYISQTVWADAKGCKVRENRPIGAILEQQLRIYLGL